MDDAQFGQFLNALAAQNQQRGYKKITAFSSGDGIEYLTWKDNFTLAAEINGWNNDRQCREAKANIEGAAARMISDIPHIVLGQTVVQLLALYEARFLPAAAGDMARVQFRTACQKEAESILQWHTRVRELFTRSYPAEPLEASVQLRDQFILGLSESKIKEYTWDSHPATFAAALANASSKSASNTVMAASALGPGTITAAPTIKQEPGINFVQQRGGGGGGSGGGGGAQRDMSNVKC